VKKKTTERPPRKPTTHYEQIPVQTVKKIVGAA
jgi:hypothetical protein